MAEEKNILVVEDDEGDMDYIQEFITDKQVPERFGVTFKTDGAERLSETFSLLEQNRYDLILLDLSLPDSEGLDTLTKVHEKAPDVPIVILTGLNDMDTSVKAMESGASHYLVKGFIDRDELVRIMKNVIKNYKNRNKPPEPIS